MKREFVTLALAGVVPMAVALQGIVPRSTPTPQAIIAFVSTQRLSNESTEGKAGVARIQAVQQRNTAAIRSLQQSLEATRQELARTPSGDARVKLQEREFQQRTELERAVVKGQSELQAMQRQVGNELQSRIRAVLDELLKGRDVQVVLQGESVVVWSAPGLDLTNELIERLNATSGRMPPRK
jgi:Skp family chaperone for outer membrane proteins